MSRPRTYFSMVSYADSAFAIGGHDGEELNSMERLSKGQGWVDMANLPYGNHRFREIKIRKYHTYIVPRFCAVADELNDRIYMIGGPKPWSKKQCRYYKVSTNTWHECVDKTLVEETYVSLALDAVKYFATVIF